MTQKQMKPEEYKSLVSRLTPHSRHVRGCFRSFWVGGLICVLGQALSELYGRWLPEEDAGTLVSVTLIFPHIFNFLVHILA